MMHHLEIDKRCLHSRTPSEQSPRGLSSRTSAARLQLANFRHGAWRFAGIGHGAWRFAGIGRSAGGFAGIGHSDRISLALRQISANPVAL